MFLSHTSELRRHPAGASFIDKVEAAVIAAGHVPVDMKHWSAEPHPPVQVCREAVESTDVYLGVLGFRYGSTVPDHHPTVSYTELEFDTAHRAGKPLLVFLLDTTEGHRELFAEVEHAREQEAFRRRVGQARITRDTATSPDELATLVERALHKLTVTIGDSPATSAGLRVWRVPPRNQVFTGRSEVFAVLRAALEQGERAVSVIHALHGMGGVGKTALAIEYAHCHGEDYDLVWWVPSEDPAMIPASLAECAQSIGLAGTSEAVGVAVARLHTFFHDHDRWLICFDNAEDPATLLEHLPAGPGHVLITSRNPNWEGIADPVALDVLGRGEAVTLLQARAPALSDTEAARVAAALDRLPLALTQAGAYLAESGMDTEHYLRLLDSRAREITARGRPADYPTSLAASWGLVFDHLADDEPAALQLLTIGAYLAPEPIPFSLFTGHTDLLPDPLAAVAGDPLAFTDLTGQLRRRALARIDTDSLTLHRLVQALLRERHDREHDNGADAP
ncbi:FxSxx-COOH system tetratricopeptide repeat protein [Actinomycetospora sp. TBRC 11914]|uniref:FxSxx-COOH system tetratricopeptide repeat protein n=1 Tax=Actinomycetospora sp. TBRC 11914 TaxID=2729387 RepID=UPI0028A151F3|nr:FxSxx-COOH system tetratricopeptide repeat protein [Actinomycetospora sp. TBRC 11914]